MRRRVDEYPGRVPVAAHHGSRVGEWAGGPARLRRRRRAEQRACSHRDRRRRDARRLHRVESIDGPGPARPQSRSAGRQPSLIGNLIQTFETLLTLATGEDIRKAAKWNRFIRDEAGKTAKRKVSIFRVAPRERTIDTIEFNGHYSDKLFGGSTSLVEWMEQGYMEAGAGRIFWDATFDAYPETPPPVG
jgi:hypothetical protein